jgi:hypothetical protein
MKIFRLFFSGSLMMLFSLHCIAQDTIYKRNSQILNANIITISTTTIQYTRPEIGEIPVYTISIDEVDHVKLKNGDIEKFNAPGFRFTTPEAPNVPSTPVPSPDYVAEPEKLFPIEPNGDLLKYKGKDISANAAFRIMRSVNDKEVDHQISLAKKNRLRQYIGFGSIPLIADGVGYLLEAELLNNNSSLQSASSVDPETAHIISGACIVGAGVCLGIAYVNHKSYIRRKLKAAELYNLRIK